MSTITISFDFLVFETSSNSFLCKFYYWDNTNLRIRPWTAIQSNKQDALTLMQTYSNDLYTSLLNIEGITPLGGGSITDYGSYSEMSNSLTIDLSSQSQDVDYTQILTSINSNLASIAANSGSIANKNNQSDIVSCLENIFTHTLSNGNKFSVLKDNLNPENDVQKINSSITRILFSIYKMLNYNSNVSYNNLFNSPENSNLLAISRKIFDISISNINNDSLSQSDLCSRLYYLIQSLMAATSNTTANIISNSLLKQISDKLANTNDLHTISQAIDLISTAIAQTPTTDTTNLEQGLTEIKESIENKDNVLLVDGTQNFVFRKEEEEID